MSEVKSSSLDTLAINTLRILSVEMVGKANSGHPGMPMGMAPVAHVLWNRIMKMVPSNPKFPNRDRFLLSNGHGCALQYALLHLAGYNLTMDDLKNFRQIDSKTPGHPENILTPGVEVTTGPLGQGIANGVGLAIAQERMAAEFNRDGFPLFNNHTFVFCGDGCLEEGISSEAASLAGHLGLSKLILIYDDNKVTIDGPTSLSFSEDVPARFRAYGWEALTVEKGDDDLEAIEAAIRCAMTSTSKPTIICLKTTIGYGSSHQGTSKVHGEPLPPAEIEKVKKLFNLSPEAFHVDQKVYEMYAKIKSNGAELENKWNALFAQYAEKYPKEAADLKRRLANELPQGWKEHLPKYSPSDKADATRNLSGHVLNAAAKTITELLGGSADLTPSNKTDLKGATDFEKGNYGGRYLRFGVREHGMAAIGNGIAAYGGLIPYTATFLNFIEYAFPAVRLSAISEFRQLYIMTHDSIGLGEDGPTHQPIEALALCRATPHLLVFRPADGNETVGCYISALEHTKRASVLALTRQNLPQLQGSCNQKTQKGGYVLQEPEDAKTPLDLIIIGTGSEVSLAVDAAKKISANGKRVRVVSMPSTTLFDEQPVEYRRQVITPGVPTVALEALGVFGWDRYAHLTIGMTTFGSSGPYQKVYDKFGLTPDKVTARIQTWLESAPKESQAMNAAFPGVLPTHFQTPAIVANAHN